MQRITAAFRKLGFCYRIAGSLSSFFKLVVNTKRFTGRTEPVTYSIKLPDGTHTICLRTHAGDLPIFYDIFLTGIYRLPSSIFLQSKTIVDIGAHIGMAALFFHAHCPQATVYCIEADPDNFALLQENLPGDNVALHAAISNSHEPVYLQKEPFSFNTHIATGVTGLSVPGITMHSFLNEQPISHIDIIKIDIEGAERMLFEGDASWLSITDNILIEIHSPENLAQFEARVKEYGFIVEARQFQYETIYWAHRFNHLITGGR
jgi:FkbM family methyltransferase